MASSLRKFRVLAVDVGVGTQDTLLYDSSKILENNIKIVLPSMTRVLAKRVSQSRGDLLFYGETMGGGPLTNAISRHIEKGYNVYMTPKSAMTIRDDLEEVKERGVDIIDEKEIDDYDCKKIETKDVDFDLIKDILGRIEEKFQFNCIGIAVQDHGHAPKKSDRVFRFEKIREALKKHPEMQEFIYENPPKYFSRMMGAIRLAEKSFSGSIMVVDTKIAAVVGAIHSIKERPVISIDVGNGHMLIAMVGEGNRFLGILEHHTHMMNRKKLEDLIVRFADGQISNKEIFNDDGHGCHIEERVGFENVKRVLVTGPRRNILKGSKIRMEFADPMGDVMMTGTMGIVDLIASSVLSKK